KKLLIYFVIVPVLALLLVSCVGESYPEPDKEAAQYLNDVQAYCAKNNLKVEGYLGKTVLRGKDYTQADEGKEPVVYEWRVINPTSKNKFVVWVGPIMPMFKNVKPFISVGKGRYTLEGMKVQDVKDKENK
ncbi:MAG: hypothetical protein AB7V50_07160, partial [Vampirovibrionia bacterium]